MMKQEVKNPLDGKSLEYWENNASEFYATTPICVLRYVGILEYLLKQVNNQKEPQWSERKKATFAFFDKLPDGLREIAKENYDEEYSDVIPATLMDAIGSGFNYEESNQLFNFWNWLFRFLASKDPSITLNGITYDLTKCYE